MVCNKEQDLVVVYNVFYWGYVQGSPLTGVMFMLIEKMINSAWRVNGPFIDCKEVTLAKEVST